MHFYDLMNMFQTLFGLLKNEFLIATDKRYEPNFLFYTLQQT